MKIRTLPSETGAGFIEYLVVFVMFGLLVLGVAELLEEPTTRFHNEAAEGLYFSYPTNFLNPTPTPAPTQNPEEEEVPVEEGADADADADAG